LTYGYAAEADIRPDAGSTESEALVTRAIFTLTDFSMATRCSASKRDPMLSEGPVAFEERAGDFLDHA
jgi:hypothetical protein